MLRPIHSTHLPRIFHTSPTHLPRIFHASPTHLPRIFHASPTHLPRSGGFATRLLPVAGLQPASPRFRSTRPKGFAPQECGPPKVAALFHFPGSQTRPQKASGCKPAATGESTWKFAWGQCGSLYCIIPVHSTCLPCIPHTSSTHLPHIFHTSPTHLPRIFHTSPTHLPHIFHVSPTFRRVCNPPASGCGFATRVTPVSLHSP